MKIAISTNSGKVAIHFGRCPQFTIVEIEDNQVENKKVIDNPGHNPGYLPKFMDEKGIDCIIAGGAGRKAQQLFKKFGIDLITGVRGEINEVIEKIISGELKNRENLCNPGEGKND